MDITIQDIIDSLQGQIDGFKNHVILGPQYLDYAILVGKDKVMVYLSVTKDIRNPALDLDNVSQEPTRLKDYSIPSSTPTPNPLDYQAAGGSYYKKGSIQPVQYCEANTWMTFTQQQIIKYASRLGSKGDEAACRLDLAKIKHYAELYEELNLNKPSGE